jgi:hypothetical protein
VNNKASRAIVEAKEPKMKLAPVGTPEHFEQREKIFQESVALRLKLEQKNEARKARESAAAAAAGEAARQQNPTKATSAGDKSQQKSNRGDSSKQTDSSGRTWGQWVSSWFY